MRNQIDTSYNVICRYFEQQLREIIVENGPRCEGDTKYWREEQSKRHGCSTVARHSQSHVLCTGSTYRWDGEEQLCCGKAMTHVHSATKPHRLGTDVFGRGWGVAVNRSCWTTGPTRIELPDLTWLGFG